MSPRCDPCGFCMNLHSQVHHIGGCAYGNDVYEDECDADIGEWEPGCGSPCPAFMPILTSESLLEEIAYEEECRFWTETGVCDGEGCE